MAREVRRIFPANKFPLNPDEDGCLPECPFGVKVNFHLEACVGCPHAESDPDSCEACPTCGSLQVARINSFTCQACVYYIQEMDSQVICSHPLSE